MFRCVPNFVESTAGSVFPSTGAQTIAEEVIADIELAWREIVYMCLIALGSFSKLTNIFNIKEIWISKVIPCPYFRAVSHSNDPVSISCGGNRLCNTDNGCYWLHCWDDICVVNIIEYVLYILKSRVI